MSADDPPDATADRGHRRLAEPAANPISRKLCLQALQCRAELVQASEERGVRAGRFEERRPHVTEPLPRPADFFPGAGHLPHQLTGLPLERGHHGEVRPRRRRGHGFHAELLRRPERLHAPTRDEYQLDVVPSGCGERPLWRTRPGRNEPGHGEIHGVGRRQLQVPAHPVQARFRGSLDPADGLTPIVAHHEQHAGRSLDGFLREHVPAREVYVFPPFAQVTLGVAPSLRGGRGNVCEIVGKGRAERRVGRRVVGAAQGGFAPGLHGNVGDVPPRVPHREQRACGQRARRNAPQRRVVVEHVEPSAERGADQVFISPLELDVPKRDRGRSAELEPVRSPIGGEVEPELRAEEEQVGILVILLQRPDYCTSGKVAGDRAPAAAAVGTLEHVRAQVSRLVRVGDGEDGGGVVLRRFDVVDEREFRHAGKIPGGAPGLSAVVTRVDQSVIGSHIEHAFGDRRFRDGGQCGILGHRTVVVEGVHAPHASHQLQLVAVAVSREVAAHRRPRVAAVVAAPQPLRAEVQAVCRVRTDEDRSVPVPPLGRIAGGGLRLDVERLLAATIDPVQVPLLRLEVQRVVIFGIERDAVAVSAHGDVPVPVAHAFHVRGPRGTQQRSQVLRAAQHVVERLRIVEGELVELRDRQVREMPPSRAVVERLVETGVGAHEQVVAVVRIDPHRVVVAVLLASRSQVVEGPAAVARDLEKHVHLIHQVGILRGGLDLLVVMRAGTAGDVGVAALPALALVARAVEASLLVVRLDGRVDQFGVGGGHGETDLAHVALGETHLDPTPALAAVGRLVDPALGAARQQRPDVAAALVRGSVQHVGVGGIELHVGNARVLVDREHLCPCVSTVDCLIETALAARVPQRALGRDEHHVTVSRVDEDLADVL